MAKGEHAYAARLVWEGNTGQGTAGYGSYDRQYRIAVDGKPDIVGSADAAFRGDVEKHNPEDLFLAAIAACHMLSYLALCARNGVTVLAYEDDPRGTLRVFPEGGGRFEAIMLSPSVAITGEENKALAVRLHDSAHDRCFIAGSCRVPIRHRATVRAGNAASVAPKGA